MKPGDPCLAKPCRLLLMSCALMWAGAMGAVHAQTTVSAAPAASASSTTGAIAAAKSTDPRPGAMARVLGRTDRLLVVMPAEGDTHAALAERFLGTATRAFWLGEGSNPATGQPLVVPLVHPNPTGVHADGLQAVPILSYHRFGDTASAMVVTPRAFEEQLQALVSGGYSVQRLSGLTAFLSGQQAWPAKSVGITVDDGHESFYRLAFPLLKKYALPVTLFLPSDAVGTRDSLTWAQLQEMLASGLVDVQPHGKTARNLAEREPGQGEQAYRRSLELEVQGSRRSIEQRLPGALVTQFAYPFGEANATVLETLQRNAFDLGLTMNPGANAFHAHPYLLRRVMVLGEHNLDTFKSRLTVLQPLPRAATP